MTKPKALKFCALCNALLADSSIVNLCDECTGQADCCVGLERLGE